MVSVNSRQFDKVLVEQNHCQGFKTVAASCRTINMGLPPLIRKILKKQRVITYRCPSSARIIAIDANCKLPSVKIADRRNNGLRYLRSGNQELGARGRRGAEDGCEKIGSFIKSGEEKRM